MSVDNNHLIALQEELARREGILAELASVTPLSAIASLKQRGIIAREDKVVAIVTASGLKDLDRSAEAAAADPKPFVSVHDAMAWLEGLHRNNHFEMPV